MITEYQTELSINSTDRINQWLVQAWTEFYALRDYRKDHTLPLVVDGLIAQELERINKTIDALCELQDKIK